MRVGYSCTEGEPMTTVVGSMVVGRETWCWSGTQVRDGEKQSTNTLQPNSDSAMWFTPMQVLSGIQSIQFKEKKNSREFNVGALVCVERDEEKWD